MPDDAGNAFTWSAHPARERAGRTVAAILVIAALAVGTALLGGSPWWAIVAVIVLAIALNRYFLPSRYAIDDEGITARLPLRTVRYRWGEMRRFAHDAMGGHLSTRTRASILDAWSGLPVQFGGDPDAVIARIRAHLPGRGA